MYLNNSKMGKLWYGVRCLCSVMILAFLCAGQVFAEINMTDGMGMGIPFGGKVSDADFNICPQGVSVIRMFLNAWRGEDFETMYELIDESSKVDYPYESARIDFQFLKYETYKISSVRKVGDNFEFILSTGDWETGDKDVKKMIISGNTFKIIMPTRNSPFKKSIDSYF